MRAGLFIPHVQSLLGDPEGDFHTTEKVLLHLNTAIEDICTRSRTICTWMFIPAIKDQGMYGLPDNFLEFKYVGFFYEDELLHLTPGSVADGAPAVFRTPPSYHKVPFTYAAGGNAHIELFVGIAVEQFDSETNPDGQGNPDTDVVIDLPIGIFNSIKPYDRLINMTDNSEGIINRKLTISGNTRILYFTDLTNGEDNKIQLDDEFRILSRTEHMHTLQIAPPPQKTDETGQESIYIFHAREHAPIEMKHIDSANDEIEFGTEWNSALRHRVCYYAALEEKGIDNAQTISFDIKYETDYMKAFPKANRRIREIISTYRSGGRRIRQKTTISHAYDHSVRRITVE